jgi:hypothetical protein
VAIYRSAYEKKIISLSEKQRICLSLHQEKKLFSRRFVHALQSTYIYIYIAKAQQQDHSIYILARIHLPLSPQASNSNKRQCRRSAKWFVWSSSCCWWQQAARHDMRQFKMWMPMAFWTIYLSNVTLVVVVVVLLIVQFVVLARVLLFVVLVLLLLVLVVLFDKVGMFIWVDYLDFSSSREYRWYFNSLLVHSCLRLWSRAVYDTEWIQFFLFLGNMAQRHIDAEYHRFASNIVIITERFPVASFFLSSF